MQLALEITPAEVKARLDQGEKLCLVDVREPMEHSICAIQGAELIPMNTVPAALQKLEAMSDVAPLMIFCHHGVRSLNVVNWLRAQGLENCQSISGGIDLWSRTIDPSIPRY